MERRNLNLRSQYLIDHEMFATETPSNYIIFKKLCGIGATHGEAKEYKRHSIIIVPNTPVLKGKKEAKDLLGNVKYPDILVVYEGVSKDDVTNYLNGGTQFKKILGTPEAYISKIKPAIEEHNDFDLFNDFFMLIDECDKIIKDADFRYSLAAPMNDFFLYKNKSMISATAMIPSDPRFESYGFKRLYVKPKYRFKQKITLIDTNNIISALNEEFVKAGDEKVFVFLNSAELIQAIIEILEIQDESKVFCAEKSRNKLVDAKLEHVSTQLGNYAKYNFLTSKFFNAVDIELPENLIDLPEKPRVIMITDILRKAFSMLDPYSDCIQIVGRFRNGIKSVVHISNFAAGLEWKEKTRAILYLKDSHDTYKTFESMRGNTSKEGAIVTLNQAMQSSFIHSYLLENGELDPYLVDGYLFDQSIISNYLYMNRLNRAYLRSNYFKPTVVTRQYNCNDNQILNARLKKTANEHLKTIVEILYANETPLEDGVLRYNFGRSNEIIGKQYPEIDKYYKTLGYEKIAALQFNKSEVKKEYTKQERQDSRFNPNLIKKVQSLYKIGDLPLEMEIAPQFQLIYNDFDIQEKARSSHVKRYFDCRRTSNPQGLKVFKIVGLKPLDDIQICN